VSHPGRLILDGSRMRIGILLILAGLAPQDAAAPLVDEDFKDLQDEDAAVRKLSFEELREIKTPSTQARLRKTVGTIASAWLKKAVAERTRAVRGLSTAAHKGFNPADFSSKQKKALDLLAAGDTRSMESIVKDLWKGFYFEPATADEDEKAKEALGRLDEVLSWQKAIGVTDKDRDSLEKTARESLRGVDETAILSLLQKKDQAVMAANAALRDQVPPPEYEQVWVTNLYRMLIGKSPLKLNPKLCEAAREHSTDMEEHNFFSHESPLPGKRTPGDRAQRHGATARGENIYMGQPSADSAFWAWFFSLGHHKNMVGDYSEIGVGNHNRYWTQMFG
jgi:uncharacterized protein YkwD